MEDTTAAQDSLQNGTNCNLQPTADEVRGCVEWDSKRISREQKGWRKVIRNFTPS